eukprot:1181956-Prorocentrum_minimum.AAC.2
MTGSVTHREAPLWVRGRDARHRLSPTVGWVAVREHCFNVQAVVACAPAFASHPAVNSGSWMHTTYLFTRLSMFTIRLLGSQAEAELRPHAPVKLASSGRQDEESSHALVTEVDEASENVNYVEIKRGDITVHDERVVHGSGPNLSDGWRRAYVLVRPNEANSSDSIVNRHSVSTLGVQPVRRVAPRLRVGASLHKLRGTANESLYYRWHRWHALVLPSRSQP